MSSTQRVIYIATNPQQAHLLRNLLAEHGIEAYVINDTLNSVHFEPTDWLVRAAGAPGFLPTAPAWWSTKPTPNGPAKSP